MQEDSSILAQVAVEWQATDGSEGFGDCDGGACLAPSNGREQISCVWLSANAMGNTKSGRPARHQGEDSAVDLGPVNLCILCSGET
jgi:hypothetical protein